MSATATATTIFGWGLMTEEWSLVSTSRFDRPERLDLEDWEVEGVEVTYLPIDQWADWKAALRGPLTLSQVALLREDATPIDARDIEPVVVPEGYYVVGVEAKFTLRGKGVSRRRSLPAAARLGIDV